MNTNEIKEEIKEMVLFSKISRQDLMIDSYIMAEYLNTNQRSIRKALSELRNEMIIFLPVRNFRNKGIYLLFNEDNQAHQRLLNSYIKSITRSLKTQYFNDVVKLKKIVRDNILVDEIGQIEAFLKN